METTKMTMEDFLQNVIRGTFGNQKKFCEAKNIPYMTVSNVLKRGISNSSINTLVRILSGLDLSLSFFFASYKFETQQFDDVKEISDDFFNSTVLLCHAINNGTKFSEKEIKTINQAYNSISKFLPNVLNDDK